MQRIGQVAGRKPPGAIVLPVETRAELARHTPDEVVENTLLLVLGASRLQAHRTAVPRLLAKLTHRGLERVLAPVQSTRRAGPQARLRHLTTAPEQEDAARRVRDDGDACCRPHAYRRFAASLRDVLRFVPRRVPRRLRLAFSTFGQEGPPQLRQKFAP